MFAFQDQENRRGSAPGLTPSASRALARRLRRAAAAAVCAAAAAIPLASAAVSQAATITPAFTRLTLVNGWTNTPYGTSRAAVANISGIVHLKGAIATNGTNPVPFTLPTADRPVTKVYVPVDMCGATNGRLSIAPSGVVTVQAEGPVWSNAQCFTSLDGVSFAKSASSFTPLPLASGWTNAPYGTSKAAARIISGVVYLKGAIATSGTDAAAFVLPPVFRPASRVTVPVDLCGATHGDLTIEPWGTAYVGAQGGSWGSAQCFTSLDGVSFAKSASSFTSLALKNGWTSFGFLFSRAAVRTISGIVHLRGAIVTTGTNPVPFTLPAGFRPATDVFVKVSLCDSTNGRLRITPSGVVTVQAEQAWSDAQCFTSLDGASFAR
jgi:hypothetical protein